MQLQRLSERTPSVLYGDAIVWTHTITKEI
nr:MAG TPA: hypothetical protein [Bacteriophage sp.]